jgi:mannonate dehydratase
MADFQLTVVYKRSLGMKLSFRWYGPDDPVSLLHIRQVPVIRGIVSALYHIPVGETWPLKGILTLKARIEESGFEWTAIESIPVHEDIKLGNTQRDHWIDKYCDSIRNMGKAGIPVLCYNFMPVFDWTRSTLDMKLPDGSTCLAYDHDTISRVDIKKGTFSLPGWATAYEKDALNRLMDAYSELTEEDLWQNLGYFLKRVIPVAEESGVRMGIHPDDPPWSIFGLPRIICREADLDRFLNIVNSPSNSLTLCTGSLGPDEQNDMVRMTDKYAGKNRIVFAHIRNIKRTGPFSFHETAHPTACGDVNIIGVLKMYHKHNFTGVLRPDHGRMIWNETGKPGYGLYDRSLGAMYIAGIWEGLNRD